MKRTHTSTWLALGTLAALCSAAAPARAQCPRQAAKLIDSGGAASDRFGNATEINGDVAVVGAWLDDDNGNDSGSAFIYRFDGTSWNQEQQLLASNGAAGDHFGFSVAIDPPWAIVGAPDADARGTDSGAVYVFRWDGTTWVEEVELAPADLSGGDLFGASVSIEGGRCIVGAPGDDAVGAQSGAVYVFDFDGSAWVQSSRVFAPESIGDALFGNTVSIRGDLFAVGARGDDFLCPGDLNCDAGVAYIFRFDGSQWLEEARLTTTDPRRGDSFGESVEVFGDRVLVGVPGDEETGEPQDENSGSAFVFRHDGSTWVMEDRLLASDRNRGDNFGRRVALDTDFAIVGSAFDDDAGIDAGSAYVFGRTGSTWTQQAKLIASDVSGGDEFGLDISISGSTVLIGATGQNPAGMGPRAGAAYVYEVGGCPADFTGDCQVDVVDFFVFVGLFSLGDPQADINGDGEINVLDFFAFIVAFAAGCP